MRYLQEKSHWQVFCRLLPERIINMPMVFLHKLRTNLVRKRIEGVVQSRIRQKAVVL